MGDTSASSSEEKRLCPEGGGWKEAEQIGRLRARTRPQAGEGLEAANV